MNNMYIQNQYKNFGLLFESLQKLYQFEIMT